MRSALAGWRSLLVLAALLGAWEVYVDLGGADPLILPAPHQVASALYTDRSLLWSNFLVTAQEVLLAIVVAVIGAVFAEQAGSNSGLGYLFQESLPQLLTARAFAAVVILSVFAITLFALLTLAERIALPWAYQPQVELP